MNYFALGYLYGRPVVLTCVSGRFKITFLD
jgi:hypothetical protein